MKKLLYVIYPITVLLLTGCEILQHAQKELEQYDTTEKPLTNSEIVAGLKQALEVGTKNAATALNKQDGYFKNPAIKILFPPDAIRAADKLRDLGMGKLVDDFNLSMNRAAEDAAAEAKPIFVNAIKQMTITDARNILFGEEDAATQYFRSKTSASLYSAFSPKIDRSLKKVGVTKYWGDITGTYNKIPFVNKVNTDLNDYVTNKALDGLFYTVKAEEKKIRENPVARVTELLQRVFGAVK